MSFNHLANIGFKLAFNIVVLGALLWSLLLPARAEEIADKRFFTVKPEKCVALRQGRECLADVTFSWKTLQVGDYCLLDKRHQKMIQCWQSSQSGQVNFSFSNQQSQHFILIEKLTKKIIMESQIEVSWVYKTKHKKRRWRLF